MGHILTPIGIFDYKQGNFVLLERFPNNPKKAADLFKKKQEDADLDTELGVLACKRMKKLFKENGVNFASFIHDFNVELTKINLKLELGKPDYRIIQIVNALNEIESSINLYSERLREWYLLYYPELSQKIRNPEAFAKIAAKESKKDSMGADLNDFDVNQLKDFAKFVSSTYKTRNVLENYLGTLMKKNFPNLNEVAGSKIGAALISIVGSAERLAKLPSSTIQVLGAERALFRHLTTGARPPKYGVILNHPLIQNAPRKLRGKIARALAAKISIAIKRDVYGGLFMGKDLKRDLDKKVKRIKKK